MECCQPRGPLVARLQGENAVRTSDATACELDARRPRGDKCGATVPRAVLPSRGSHERDRHVIRLRNVPCLRPVLLTIACGVSLALAPAVAALPSTSISFNVPGFQVTRVWAGSALDANMASRSSLGIPANIGGLLFSSDG